MGMHLMNVPLSWASLIASRELLLRACIYLRPKVCALYLCLRLRACVL